MSLQNIRTLEEIKLKIVLTLSVLDVGDQGEGQAPASP